VLSGEKPFLRGFSRPPAVLSCLCFCQPGFLRFFSVWNLTVSLTCFSWVELPLHCSFQCWRRGSQVFLSLLSRCCSLVSRALGTIMEFIEISFPFFMLDIFAMMRARVG